MEKVENVSDVITPILVNIENLLWEHEAKIMGESNYPDETLRASLKIFMNVMMDKMWRLQTMENIPLEHKLEMGEKLGEDIKKMVKTYCDIDTSQLYN